MQESYSLDSNNFIEETDQYTLKVQCNDAGLSIQLQTLELQTQTFMKFKKHYITSTLPGQLRSLYQNVENIFKQVFKKNNFEVPLNGTLIFIHKDELDKKDYRVRQRRLTIKLKSDRYQEHDKLGQMIKKLKMKNLRQQKQIEQANKPFWEKIISPIASIQKSLFKSGTQLIKDIFLEKATHAKQINFIPTPSLQKLEINGSKIYNASQQTLIIAPKIKQAQTLQITILNKPDALTVGIIDMNSILNNLIVIDSVPNGVALSSQAIMKYPKFQIMESQKFELNAKIGIKMNKTRVQFGCLKEKLLSFKINNHQQNPFIQLRPGCEIKLSYSQQ